MRTCALAFCLLAACGGEPSVHTGGQTLVEDGIQVELMLDNVREVRFAGLTARDGEPVTIPFARLAPGSNSFPIEGLEGKAVHVKLQPKEVLQLSCERSGDGPVSVTFQWEGMPSYEAPPTASGCPQEAGRVIVGFQILPGFEVELDRGEVEADTLRLDVRDALWAEAVPEFGTYTGGRYASALPLRIRSASGAVWEGEVKVDLRGDLLSSVAGSLPQATADMPEAADVAAMRLGGRWWFKGEGTIGQTRLFVRPVEEVARPLKCTYQDYGMPVVKRNLAISGIDTTFAAFDREGREVARKRFRADCPAALSLKPGQKELRVLPSSEEVGAWMETLL